MPHQIKILFQIHSFAKNFVILTKKVEISPALDLKLLESEFQAFLRQSLQKNIFLDFAF
jgi:hypothetical protein